MLLIRPYLPKIALNARVPLIVTNLPARLPPVQPEPHAAALPQVGLPAEPVGHQQLLALAAVPPAVVLPPLAALVGPAFTVTVAPAQAAPLAFATMPLSVAASAAPALEFTLAAFSSAYSEAAATADESAISS